MWYFRLDSNLQHAAFEAASSASWDTEALLIYINFPKTFSFLIISPIFTMKMFNNFLLSFQIILYSNLLAATMSLSTMNWSWKRDSNPYSHTGSGF